jgi:hypothetical protein
MIYLPACGETMPDKEMGRDYKEAPPLKNCLSSSSSLMFYLPYFEGFVCDFL